ncbi:MAG TPA: hypothetical protein VIF62_24815, partial [Labilithrix sp.]
MYRPSALLFFVLLCAPAAAWIGCGSSSNTDVTPPPGDDGDDGGDVDTGVDSGLAPLVCTSKQTWANGDRGSVDMHPGRACIDCHSTNFGPTFQFGGTVYPTGHEPNDCYGVNGGTLGLSVVITGADNTQLMLPVNGVGNFNSDNVKTKIMFPFHAYVGTGCTQAEAGAPVDCTGKIRGMVESQTTGDCNSCHT